MQRGGSGDFMKEAAQGGSRVETSFFFLIVVVIVSFLFFFLAPFFDGRRNLKYKHKKTIAEVPVGKVPEEVRRMGERRPGDGRQTAGKE